MRQLHLLPLGLLTLAALFVGPAPVAQAATFTVDSTLDTADALAAIDCVAGDLKDQSLKETFLNSPHVQEIRARSK
ncbi:MAG: hypothetical protein V3U86_03330 [Acidobacteriota bacterium]